MAHVTEKKRKVVKWTIRISCVLPVMLLAWFAVFVNPGNWKNFVSMTTGDWLLLVASNAAIIGLCGFLWWVSQKSLISLLTRKAKEANKAVEIPPRRVSH